MVCANCRRTFTHLPSSVPCPDCGSTIKSFDPGLTQVWSPGMSAVVPERAAPSPALSSPIRRRRGIARALRYSNAAVGSGLLLEIGGVFLLSVRVDLGTVVLLAGSLLFTAGLCWYAESKGYSALLGLLGLFSIIGLLILLVLPPKQVRSA